MIALRRLWPFLPRMDRRLHVIGITQDRRTKAQRESYGAIEQERADLALERQWRENIRLNELARLERKLKARQEAELPEETREFDSWQDEQADSAGVPRFGEI